MTTLLGRIESSPKRNPRMRAPVRMLVFLAASAVGALAAAAPGVGEIESFHAVTDRVAIGAQPTPEQVIALANAGFNGIITLREESELNDGPQSHAAVTSGVQFFRIPVSRENPSDAAVEKFLMVTDDENVYPLFIYCASGNRAAALWMIRRVLRDRWTVSDAEAEAARVGLTSATMRDFARDYIRRHPAH